MQIGYLGPLEVRDGGEPLALPGSRLQRLVLHLATEPGRWRSAGALVDAVWDDPPADPANSLQSLVSRLRRALGRPELVEQSPAGYRLAVAPDDVDAARFSRLVTEARGLLTADPAAAGSLLRAALDLWRDEPLTGEDSAWAAGRRAALVDLRLAAERDLAGLAVREGRAADVLPALEELVAGHPLREDLAGALVDALAAAGRPAEALAAYERLRGTLAEELGTDPSPALRARHAELLRAGDRPAVPRSTVRATLTSFVGRADDVRSLRAALASGRLVTVVGAGGAGKTRLAAEVAAGLVAAGDPAVADGAWLVELAPLSDPEAVAQAVLEGMGVRDVAVNDPHADRAPRATPRQRLLDLLRPSSCLLVVDNCEHLVDAVADLVAELLGRCPAVRVLATSREPLGIDGERLHPLGPLPVPAEGADPGEAASSPAVQLLLDRARAVDPGVRADAAVVEIVRRLDGLPLAVELAAARFRSLTPAEVAARLGDRFQLLTGGRRTAAPRHRTLRAVVEWSWELLSPREREVVEHVAVFAAGADEEAVAAVAPSWRGAGDRGELTDVLHALVDKSLLVAEHAGAGTRFRMLETLREYGTERLAEQGVLPTARAAHAAHFAGVAARLDPQLRGPGQADALQALDERREDLLAALRSLVDGGRTAAALDLAVHLGWYWMLRETTTEAVRWLGEVLALPDADAVPAAALAHALLTLQTMGEAPAGGPAGGVDSKAPLAEAGRRLADAGIDHPLADVLEVVLLMLAGDRLGSDAVLDRMLSGPDPWVRAAGRMVRVTQAENDGEIDAVRADVDRAVGEWEAVGDRWGLAAVLATRGQLRTMSGDLLGAAADLERAQACIEHLGGTSDEVMVTMRLTDLRLRAGDVDGARAHLAAMRARRSFPAGAEVWTMLVLVAEIGIALVADDPYHLDRSYAELAARLREQTAPTTFQAHGGAVGHASAATAALRLGRPDEARAHLRDAYRHGVLTEDRPILALIAAAAAAVAEAGARPEEAARLLGAAARLRGAEDLGDPHLRGLVDRLRSALGSRFQECYEAGRRLDGDAATALVGDAAS
ncbi:Predicted ATPase [Blastococcus fimeti]|nr:Predicted ATPase [Blastococcus fimeti]